jgi:hypothetical protein
MQASFYFTVVVWGEKYRLDFLNHCLRSLLFPGNLPCLPKPVKILIATTPDDWRAMQLHQNFLAVSNYAEPVFVEIPGCPPWKSACEHMGIGHELTAKMCYADKAVTCLLTPDLMLSEYSLFNAFASGFPVVLAVALRFAEETFLPHMTGVASGRDMVRAALHGLHSETMRYEWDAPYLEMKPGAVWWKAPQGMLIHSFSWAPVILDYSKVGAHDTSTFDKWTIDGDYVYRNWGESGVHAVTDSDDGFVCSWSPLAQKPKSLEPHSLFPGPHGMYTRGALLRAAFHSKTIDPMKRKLFAKAVKWHAEDLNADWNVVEDRAWDDLSGYLKL